MISRVLPQNELKKKEQMNKRGLIFITNKSVHVEDPVKSVDLWESGYVHRETAVGEHNTEHCLRFELCVCVFLRGFKDWSNDVFFLLV